MSRLASASLSLAKGHSGDTKFLAISGSKGACFCTSQSEMVPVIFPLGGSNDHSPAQPQLILVLWVSVSPAVLVPNPCELCVLAELTCRAHRAPVLGPVAAQASLFSVVALNTSLSFCANDTIPLPVTENQGFTLCQEVSSYHPRSCFSRKQNQKHIHNNPPK